MKVPASECAVIDLEAPVLSAGKEKVKPKWGKIPMPKIRPHSSIPKSRTRKRPPRDSCPRLVRQWKLLERLNQSPGTLNELAAACRVCEKTVHRDLIVLEKAGFRLKAAVEEFGRKHWQLKEPLRLPETNRQQYRSIGRLLDVLAEKVAHLNDRRLAADLQAIRQRVAKKCG